MGSDLDGLRQALYYLQDQMESREGPYLAKGTVRRDTQLNPRYVYSYFALYGDPLMETDIDPFPDGFLEKLARAGVNGVWLQAVLRNLAPSKTFPEFGAGWETRVRNLNKLVERAGKYGVKVYFYLNEPRSMPAGFFAQHPEIKGTHDPGRHTILCHVYQHARSPRVACRQLGSSVFQRPGVGRNLLYHRVRESDELLFARPR